MKQLHRALVACLLAGSWSVGHAAQPGRELVEPAPIAVPAGVDQAALGKTIKRALLSRDWSVVKDEPGYVEGQLNVRQHMLKVGISYDAKRVSLKYVDSAELAYRELDGKKYIHPKYRNWTNNVMTDISKQLDLDQLEKR